MSYQLHIRDEQGERQVSLQAAVTVGRDPACTISIDDPRLSRRHAEFVQTGNSVMVRDLGSRNGLEVNGVRSAGAVLHERDVVTIAGLTLSLRPDGMGLGGMAPRPVSVTSDRTVVTLRTPAAAPVALPMDEKTRLAARTMAPPPPAAAAANAEPTIAPLAAETAAVEGEQARPARARAWSRHVSLWVAALAAALVVTNALMLSWLQGQAAEISARERAAALSNWFAAEARAAGSSTAALDAVADRLGREAGVTSAVLVSADGRVLAPRARMSEAVATFAGSGRAPKDVTALEYAQHDDLLEVTQPVAGLGSPVAWLLYRPVGTGVGFALAVGVSLLVALVGTVVVANALRRATLQGLARFREDVELSLNGQLAAVQDTLGARPLEDLATVINYLVLRARSGAGRERDVVAAGGRDAGPAAPAASGARDAWVIADPQLRITEMSASCAGFFGVRADAFVGRHLLEAFADRAVADALLKCLSNVSVSGLDQTRVNSSGDRAVGDMFISVERLGKQDPITVRFSRRAERSA